VAIGYCVIKYFCFIVRLISSSKMCKLVCVIKFNHLKEIVVNWKYTVVNLIFSTSANLELNIMLKGCILIVWGGNRPEIHDVLLIIYLKYQDANYCCATENHCTFIFSIVNAPNVYKYLDIF
jgi:hypothetical protein